MTTLTKEDAERFRHRVEYEDELLNARTTIVLELNGLAAIAVGLPLPQPTRLCIVIIMMIIDAVWISLAAEAAQFITKLSNKLRENNDSAPSDEVFRWQVVDQPGRIGPTKFFGVVMPLLLFLGWVFAVLYAFWVA
ncbi:MAG: hypothetical protein HY043_21815 [Verrucomicrobia bacterium]|nr:hypothetical protein [Verrucomicrobiota bacterium]